MIHLGLRLAVGRGGARIRLVLMTVGIAIGTAGFLGALGYQHARSEMAHRAQVRTIQTDVESVDPGALLWNVAYVSDPAKAQFTSGYMLIRTAPGSNGLLPLGAPAAPRPGTAYVSPAVARLLRADGPAGDRWRALVPWRVVGTLGRPVLVDPGERVVVAGADAAQVAAGQGTRRVDDWAAVSAATPPARIGPTELIAFAVIAAIALAPIVIFVASVARVGQRRRDERAAALRLLGAGSRQLAVLAAAEAGLAGIVGAGLGVLAIEGLAVRPAIEFWSVSVFTADLLPSVGHIVLALVLVPLLAIGTAWVSLVRALAVPLQTRRRADRRAPGVWRLAPVAAGWAAMAYLLHSAPSGSTTAAVAIGLAVALMIVGIVLSGGYVLHHVSRVVRRAPGAAATIAGRRLEADAVGGFRAISGLAVAFAVATAGLVVGASLRLHDSFAVPIGVQALGPTADAWLSLPSDDAPAARVTTAAKGTPGVVATAEVWIGSGSSAGQTVGADCRPLAALLAGAIRCPAQAGALVPASAGPVGGSISVDHLDPTGNALEAIDVPIAGHVPDGLSIAGISPVVIVPPDIVERSGGDAGAWLLLTIDRDPLTLARLAGNISRDAVVDLAVSSPGRPSSTSSSTVPRVQRILTGITLLALMVAAIGLAIGAIDALVARRRTLAHLAATGVSGRTLRAATTIELAVPMVTAVCLAFVLGVGIGATFYRLYYGDGAIVLPWGRAGLLLALAFLATAAVAAATLPVVARASRPDQLRTE